MNEANIAIKITPHALRGLANLSDKQLEKMGYDPQSITLAAMDLSIEQGRASLPEYFPSSS